MNAIFVPILFTVLAVALGSWILATSSRVTREWSPWDTMFVVLLVLGVVGPTWTVYFSHHWYVALVWTILAIGLAKYLPQTYGRYSKHISSFLRVGLASVVVTVSWVSWFIILCETQWQQGRNVFA